MLSRVCLPAALAAAVLALSGCGPAKLNETRTYDLDSGVVEGFIIPAQPKPQKITVEFKSSDGEVSVLVFKHADATGDEAMGADPKKALGQERGTEKSFTTDVPENTETRLVVRGAGKKTKVDLKVTNK